MMKKKMEEEFGNMPFGEETGDYPQMDQENYPQAYDGEKYGHSGPDSGDKGDQENEGNYDDYSGDEGSNDNGGDYGDDSKNSGSLSISSGQV